MSSGLPLRTDIARRSRHVANVPIPEVVTIIDSDQSHTQVGFAWRRDVHVTRIAAPYRRLCRTPENAIGEARNQIRTASAGCSRPGATHHCVTFSQKAV